MKKSHIFWLSFGFAIQIALAFIQIEILYILWTLGSFVIIIAGFDKELPGDEQFNWPIWFPLYWIFAIIVLTSLGVYRIFKYPLNYIAKIFNKFNDMLDSKK